MKSEPELYKPAEACKMAEVAPYVLRYWETEFPALAEAKEKGAGRLYSARDIRIIARIRELLYDEGFTVAGAKKRLDGEISEGRFEEGLSSAPTPAEQRKPGKARAGMASASDRAASPAPIVETSDPLFLAEPPPAKSPAVPARSDHHAPPELPGTKEILRELKDIVRLLDHGRKRA